MTLINRNIINSILEFGKVRITAFVAISSALGYILPYGQVDLGLLFNMIGVFVLSFGSAALNQWQEVYPDSLMNRTKKRPLPTNLISRKSGLLISLLTISLGLLILILNFGLIPFLLGVLAIIWYNFIYTPMKMKTALAVFPGALIGAIPPAIGWTASGGLLTEPQLWALALFFFIWQIPHFWLLLMVYDDDYRRGGFPTLTNIFSKSQLVRITYVWIIGLVASCFLIPLFGGTKSLLTISLLIIAGIWLIIRTKSLLNLKFTSSTIIEPKVFKMAFLRLNFFVLIVMMLLTVDKLITNIK
ncbi:MAG: protoheme IX farnesyltransferase [Candidatus Kapabacteria bacterium]|nr:protoheme IX farnesyltransferase [Candidatus Kapabacteria bacterium]